MPICLRFSSNILFSVWNALTSWLSSFCFHDVTCFLMCFLAICGSLKKWVLKFFAQFKSSFCYCLAVGILCTEPKLNLVQKIKIFISSSVLKQTQAKLDWKSPQFRSSDLKAHVPSADHELLSPPSSLLLFAVSTVTCSSSFT